MSRIIQFLILLRVEQFIGSGLAIATPGGARSTGMMFLNGRRCRQLLSKEVSRYSSEPSTPWKNEVPKSASLSQVNAQIERLQQQAEALKAKELTGVIARMKEAIKHYGLTAADLGLSKSRGAKAGAAGMTVAKNARKSAAKKGRAGVIRYKSPDGLRTWTGHGRAPAWFKEALEAGASRESLAV